jgi:hypothetical protein
MIVLRRSLIYALIQCLVLGSAVFSHASFLRCSDSLVAFECEGEGDFKCVCTASKVAIDFLKSIGLETAECITVRLVDQIPSNRDHVLIGAYNQNSREVTLLNYSIAIELSQKNTPTPDIEMSEELWCSYAAHEIAHVISSHYLDPKIKAHTAGEYISAVTQLTVLPAKIRNKFLLKYGDVTPYQSRAEMSETYFLLDPNRFAVKCYLHFISLDNPGNFIDHLVREGNGY